MLFQTLFHSHGALNVNAHLQIGILWLDGLELIPFFLNGVLLQYVLCSTATFFIRFTKLKKSNQLILNRFKQLIPADLKWLISRILTAGLSILTIKWICHVFHTYLRLSFRLSKVNFILMHNFSCTFDFIESLNDYSRICSTNRFPSN